MRASGYEATHPVRVCRERCAEAGFSGEHYHECVRRCVEGLRKGGG